MLDISINLGVKYVRDCPQCKIICNDAVVYDSELSHDKTFNVLSDGHNLDISIQKKGLLRDNHQKITINDIWVNGIQMDVINFGKFFVEWNKGVENHWLKTTECDYNGTWYFNIKCPYSLIGTDNLKNDKIKQPFEDCDIACFGDSSTYGQFLAEEHTWPYIVGSETGLNSRNYGVYSHTGASNFNQIFAMIKKYTLQHRTKHILIMLPPAFKKQVLLGGKIVNAGEWHPDTHDYFLNNEAHHLSLLISQMEDFLKMYCNDVNVKFATVYNNDHKFFAQSKIANSFVDFIDPSEYPQLGDFRKHYDHSFCLKLADKFSTIIKKHDYTLTKYAK